MTAAVLVRLPFLDLPPIYPDEGVYALTAQRWALGELPYAAVWDHHPPGLPALLLLLAAPSGGALPAMRVLSLLSVALTAGLLCHIAVLGLRSAFAGCVAALAYVVATGGREGLYGNTELVDNALVSAAAALLLHAWLRQGGVWRVAAAGLALGVSLQVKLLALAPIAVFGGLYLLACRRDGRAVRAPGLALVAGVLLPSLLALSYFAAGGRLAELLAAVVQGNWGYLADALAEGRLTAGNLRGALPMLGLLAGCLVLLAPGALPRWARIGLLAWLLAAAAMTLMPLHLWRHHFLVLLPPSCLATGLAAVRLGGLAGKRRQAAAAAAALLLVLPSLRVTLTDWAWLRPVAAADAPGRVAAEIIRLGGEPTLYVGCDLPAIYVLTGMAPPRQIFWAYHFDATGPLDEAVAPGADAAGHLLAALAARPRFIVTRDQAVPPPLAAALVDPLAGYELVLEAPGGGVPAVRLFLRR